MENFSDLFLALLPIFIVVVVVVLSIWAYRKWGSLGLIGALFFWPLLIILQIRDKGIK